MIFKNNIEEYTENEFLTFLSGFFENPNGLQGNEFKKHRAILLDHFDNIVKHPEGNGLIFYPPTGREDTPVGVLNEIKRWRKSQGLPLFKDSK